MARTPGKKQINFIPADDVLELLANAENKTEVINEAIRIFYQRGGKTIGQRVSEIEKQLAILVERSNER